jgi:putative redox protein
MSGKTHLVRLTQIGPAAFQADAAEGGSLIVDGSPDIGGEGRGMRPTEVLLSALASCAAMDVVHILRKQRQGLEQLTIHTEGTRVDGTPAPFETIKMVFEARGAVDDHKLQRAVQLAVEKYCSVGASLDPKIQVKWEARLVGTAAAPAATPEEG